MKLKEAVNCDSLIMAEQETRPKRQVYVGNSQRMLSEIRESLKHLKRKPENVQQKQQTIETRTSAAFTENVSTAPSSSGTSQHLTNATRNFPHNNNNNNRRSSYGHPSYAPQLAEIRNSIEPYFYGACESGYSSCSECSTPSAETINKQFLHQLVTIGFEEVGRVSELTLCKKFYRILFVFKVEKAFWLHNYVRNSMWSYLNIHWPKLSTCFALKGHNSFSDCIVCFRYQIELLDGYVKGQVL